MPTFSPHQLTAVAEDVFVAAGLKQGEARTVAEHLVQANLAGHDSHGVLRIPEYVEWMAAGDVVPGQHVSIIYETPVLAVMEGGWGFGQVIGLEAFEVAMEKARENGVGIVAVSRCGHIGRVGHYPYLAAEQGLVTVMFVNTHGGGKLAAPWGGRGRRLSANPISVGIPRKDGEPLVLDMATSAIADGKLKDMLNRGVPAPAGCIVDADGNPTTDPADYVGPPEGALLPFGGHKGFGLSFVIDILAGALSGAGCSRDGVNRIGNGFLAIVILPEKMRDGDGFYSDVEGLVQHVKGSELAAGFDEILAPGEPEIRTRQQRSRDGIRVDETAWGKICAAAERYGVRLDLSE